MGSSAKKPYRRRQSAGKAVTIRDLAEELDLSITTISRALGGYSDVSEQTRERIQSAADRMGYSPNRNAQRLVTQRTHNWAWVHEDNERKLIDPHFVEVMAGMLRGARAASYDIVLTSAPPAQQLAAYNRYIHGNAADGFMVDLPRLNDPRISLLLERNQKFVVHGREDRSAQYSWVDIDNYGIYFDLVRLLAGNGHKRIAFINGDENYTYAHSRRQGVEAALDAMGLPRSSVDFYRSTHPMGDAGFALTSKALEDKAVTAILYSSTLMAMEGHSALLQAGRKLGETIAIATMDDQLHYIDLSIFGDKVSFARSSLSEAGLALARELVHLCDDDGGPRGTLIPHHFSIAKGMDAGMLKKPA